MNFHISRGALTSATERFSGEVMGFLCKIIPVNFDDFH